MSPLGRWTADSFLKLYVRLQYIQDIQQVALNVVFMPETFRLVMANIKKTLNDRNRALTCRSPGTMECGNWKRTFPSRTLFGNVRPNPAIEGEYLNGRKHPPNRSFTSGGY